VIFSVSWLKRKKTCLCALAGVCSVSLFVIFGSGEKIGENKGSHYAVKIRHYGIDAAQMERNVTIPLEDALSAVPDVIGMQSSSENSLSSVFVRFKPGGKGRYEAIRDAAQRVYETLPSSAQRPEILCSGNSRIPVWSASVSAAKGSGGTDVLKENVITARELEKNIKPRLESLEGAAEVLVFGAGLKEIVIVLDQQKIAAAGLDPHTAVEFLAMNDSVFSGGSVKWKDREIIVTVDGRYAETGESGLGGALIPLGDEKFISLSQIAEISWHERAPDILSRLNGKKTAGIAVMGRYGADLRKLSADIKRELSESAGAYTPYEFTVLSDLGAEEDGAFRSVFNAALTGAVMTALACFLLNINNVKNRPGWNLPAFFCAVSIPLICVVSAALLYIGGFQANRLMFAGIAAGAGTAVDAVILCSEKLRFRRQSSHESASLAMKELAGPLTAGAATTIAALLPLAAQQNGEIKIIALAIAAVTFTALMFSLFLLPPLLLWKNDSALTDNAMTAAFTSCGNQRLSRLTKRIARACGGLFRILRRMLAVNVRFCARYPVPVVSAGLVITFAAAAALIVKGADTGFYGSEDSVYAQVEFDGGLLSEEADRLLAVFSETLARNRGIVNVETGARTGSGSVLISFDQKLTKAHLVRDAAKQISIPGGFLFFNESSKRERYWEISVCGDEDRKCRELAEELARICAGHPVIRERVLNFKDSGQKIIFKPDMERLAASGTGFSNAANRIRLGVYGPVAYKRTEKEGEIDVRIRTGNAGNDVMRTTKEETLGLLIPADDNKSFTSGVDSLMLVREEKEPSSIRRTDRRRTASITVTTLPMDPRRVRKELSGLFARIDLPPGYSVEFDPEAIRQAQVLSSTAVSLVFAVIFCFMIIAAINESFAVPVIVISAIPPSLAVPALCLALSGSAYNSSVACAFIAVSGMTVNASVLCVDELRKKTGVKPEISALGVYLALRKKLPALLATTGTTVAGAIPFIFLTEGANALIKTLSLTGAIGIACSCFCSVTIIPSLTLIFNKMRITSSHNKLFRLCGI